VKGVYEASLVSAAANGSVEFVLFALGDVVMFVIEAKKEDFSQGTAQLLMQLHGISV
jgi:hypothetical protein